jgi:two-component system KDP operon response regulator KdpE
MTARILICDPDPQVQRTLQFILRGAGYEVLTTATAQEALDCAERAHPQAAIVELALPDLSGIELCRRLYEGRDMPILVLSGISEETTKIEAFDNGADDYVTKPFSPGELVARVAAKLRGIPNQSRVEADGVVIDITAHLVTIDGEEVHLTPTEFTLLSTLATSGGPVTHEVLATNVWRPLPSNAEERVRTHIAHLRAKLGRDRRRNLIRTEVGIGYRFAGRR